jgi:hypothetical protein
MALPLNVFKTITTITPTSPVGIYTAPVGYSSVVLLAQCSNISSNTETVSFAHIRNKTGIAVTTEILQNFPISANDAASLLTGKLILESGDSLVLSGSNNANLKFIASILETLS